MRLLKDVTLTKTNHNVLAALQVQAETRERDDQFFARVISLSPVRNVSRGKVVLSNSFSMFELDKPRLKYRFDTS